MVITIPLWYIILAALLPELVKMSVYFIGKAMGYLPDDEEYFG